MKFYIVAGSNETRESNETGLTVGFTTRTMMMKECINGHRSIFNNYKKNFEMDNTGISGDVFRKIFLLLSFIFILSFNSVFPQVHLTVNTESATTTIDRN